MTRTVLEVAEAMIPLVKANLERDGLLKPVVFVLGRGDHLSVFSLEFTSAAAKDACFAVVRQRASTAQGVVAVMDAWITDVDADRPVGRREAVMVELADNTGLRECWTLPYSRPAPGRIAWGQRVRTTDFSSRLLDPLYPDA